MQKALETLYFELTGACNLLCKHCYVFSSDRARERPDKLTLALIEKTISEAKTIGLKRLTFTGGEIFLRPDVRDILAMASEHAPLYLLTNLTLMKEDDYALMQKLNISMVSTSLDGGKTDHDALRQRDGSFDKTLGAVLRLRDLGVKVKVSVTVHESNVSSARALFAFLDTEGIPSSIARIAPIGRGEHMSGRRPIFFDRAYYEIFAERIARAIGRPNTELTAPGEVVPTHCGVGESILYVLSNGIVGLCPTLTEAQGREWIVGDLCIDSISDCWSRTNAKFEQLRCSGSSKCEFGSICRGGCRANAFARTGDIEACDQEMYDGLSKWRSERAADQKIEYRVV